LNYLTVKHTFCKQRSDLMSEKKINNEKTDVCTLRGASTTIITEIN
jgi:hypothetical protein